MEIETARSDVERARSRPPAPFALMSMTTEAWGSARTHVP
jgi:hypothetical protein